MCKTIRYERISRDFSRNQRLNLWDKAWAHSRGPENIADAKRTPTEEIDLIEKWQI